MVQENHQHVWLYGLFAVVHKATGTENTGGYNQEDGKKREQKQYIRPSSHKIMHTNSWRITSLMMGTSRENSL